MLKPVYILWLFISIAILATGLVLVRVSLPVLPTLRPVRTYIQPGNISPTTAENVPTENVTVDFAKQISTGSPLIFGGAHAPDINHQDAWDKIADVGVTIIRRDFFIEWEVVRNITLTDYKNNANDIQNPDKWNNTNTNWTNISITNQIYENAKKRGMKVMGILSYAPAWLTFSGTANGIPEDWEVYEDIVRKLYKIHRPYLDFLEIWNEPDYPRFLDTENSLMSRSEAYSQIFYHAQKAIREIDKQVNDGKKIPIGAMAVSNPTDVKFFEDTLKRIIINSNVDFISYHNYEQAPEPSWTLYKKVLSKYGKSESPVFLTEWNHNYRANQTDSYHYTDLAISYTGRKLISFLNMGLAGANYFNMSMINLSKPNTYEGSFGFYRIANGQAELLPQAKTWRLLSKSLGLGKGESKIYNSQLPISISAAGFENSDGQKGLAIVNGQDMQQSVSVSLRNYGSNRLISGKVSLDVYTASAAGDGSAVVDRIVTEPDQQGNISFAIILPPQSVTGIIQPAGLNLRQIIRNVMPFIPG